MSGNHAGRWGGDWSNPEDMARRYGDLLREGRANNVTIVVVDGHMGPPQKSEHPTDGLFFECSYNQARALDRDTPLKLVKVIARDRAHFEVAGPFPWSGGRLCPPPYEVR